MLKTIKQTIFVLTLSMVPFTASAGGIKGPLFSEGEIFGFFAAVISILLLLIFVPIRLTTKNVTFSFFVYLPLIVLLLIDLFILLKILVPDYGRFTFDEDIIKGLTVLLILAAIFITFLYRLFKSDKAIRMKDSEE